MQTEDRNLIAFLALTFAVSWLLWAPRVLSARGATGVPTPPNVGAFGPTVAAFVLTYLTRRREGVVELARRVVDVDFRARWWLPTLFLFPAINVGLLLVGHLQGDPLPSFPWREQPLTLPVAFVVVLLTTGPLQEEFGWRGYALDRIQRHWNALVASLIFGVVWATWHLPLFFFDEAVIYRPENVVGFVPSILMVTVVITWIYNNTGGSLLPALLVHASFNFSHWALPVLETTVARELYPFVLLGVTASVVLYWGPDDLSRRPRGVDDAIRPRRDEKSGR